MRFEKQEVRGLLSCAKADRSRAQEQQQQKLDPL